MKKDKDDSYSNQQEPLMRALTEPMKQKSESSRTTLGLRTLLWMLSGVRVGSVAVTLPNGNEHVFQGTETGPHGVIRIHSGKMINKVISNGEVGFGEAYLDGDWDSPDLTALLSAMYLNEPHLKGPYDRMPFAKTIGRIGHWLKSNSKSGSKENISYHYDLGNEFYKMWLDDTMAYSSAMFVEPNQTLKDAQLNKFKLMFDRLELKPEHSLLEIGSGWGGFAIYAAKHAGCTVHSITLSEEQLKEAQIRAEKAGVADKVTFELRDYRDVSETYDRVVSIEMYEAVGEKYWPGFFQAIHKALKPGGVAAIQGITINENIFDQYRSKRDFIQKYIFPGGMLCPPTHFQNLAAKEGLEPIEPKFYAKDYADTLAHWHRNVMAKSVKDKILQQFDQRFLRMWRYYLSYCECGFLTGSIDLMQVSLRKPA